MTIPARHSPDSLAQELENEILRGVVQPGHKLPSERVLAERHGVSRPVVREALRSLEERRLVKVVPARGAFVTAGTGLDVVTPLDLVYRRRNATARHLVEARVMLESQAAFLAAQRATRDDVRALRSTLERMESCDDQVEHVRFDLAFHLALARASHNPVIETMFASIAAMAVELMLRSVADPEVSRRSHPYHRVAFEAVLERDAEAAAQALRDHLRVADVTYGADYDRSLDVMARREVRRLLGGESRLDELMAEVLASVPQVDGSQPAL